MFISPYVPYDKVGHAGGQVHNYYVKKMHKDSQLELKIVTFAEEEECKKIDFEEYKISADVIVKKKGTLANFYRKSLNATRKFNVFEKSAGMMSNYMKVSVSASLRKMKKQGYSPDVIILEWTPTITLIDVVKGFYPKAKIISVEHDVSFLLFERLYLTETSQSKKFIRKIKYNNLLKFECEQLRKSDKILTLNYKDKNLLLNQQIEEEKIDVITPYYSKLTYSDNRKNNKKLLFFGAMDRKENYESCIWFIDNVLKKLLEIDNQFTFYIVGSKPPKKLLEYQSENVIVTGFVESVDQYFLDCMCMVAPLVMGAGIKVKILEGMSSGIPILTNDIGIEGIPAIDGKDYLHCTSPEEYINTIINLANGKYNLSEISRNSAELLRNEFDLEKSFKKYLNIIEGLIENKNI